MSWLKKILCRCDLPIELPVTEDQRFWTCPKCESVWEWTELEGGVGWAKQR